MKSAALVLLLSANAWAGPEQYAKLPSTVPEPFAAKAEESGRIFHSAVWTGKEVIVWGGGADGRFHNGGVRIDPASKSSRTVSVTAAPAARWGHAAVWTGDRMIVWGGRDRFESFGNKNDGALYDPATDSWKPMSAESAPEGRSQAACAWTGKEMIAWGGFGEGSTAWSGGGSYDPRADRWTALSASGAPSARAEPVSVWTGSEFIVWGGITPDLKRTLSDGGRYNPASNTWTAIKEADSPRGVWGTRAVWTGTEMLVWGGAGQNGDENVNHLSNEGVAYNPVTGDWRKIGGDGAPCARFFHSTVWTGSSMIVWGGGDQQGPQNFNDGAEYIVSENQWRPLDWPAAPAARGMHTATWTPQGMVVFGGSTGGSNAFSGPDYYVRK